MNGRELDRNLSGGQSGQHLSEDALLNQLYGLNDHRPHLERCDECSARWRDLLERRSRLTAEVEVPNEFLWAERRKIYARLGQERPSGARWAPAWAAAGLLAVAAFLYHPAAPAPERSDSTDAQLFSEAYSMEQSLEPRAAAPIHALFEDNQ